MKIALTLTSASILAFSSFASAELELSMAEMDVVSAGGSAAADAFADAFGDVTSATTNTVADVVSIAAIPGQVGNIKDVTSTALAASASDSDSKAIGTANAAGVTMGTLLSDTVSLSSTLTQSKGLPFSNSSASNTSVASSIILGLPASASSASSAAALLQN